MDESGRRKTSRTLNKKPDILFSQVKREYYGNWTVIQTDIDDGWMDKNNVARKI